MKMEFKDSYFTIDVDLSQHVAEIYKNIDKKIRWGIRKAEKSGVDYGFADKEDFDRFCELCEKFGYVKNVREDLEFAGEDGEVVVDKKHKGILIVAKYCGNIVGGLVTKFIENESIFSISFVLSEYKNLEVNSFLLWQAIKLSKERGFKIFSLGGVAPNAREGTKFYHIFQFKSKWGGELKKREVKSKNFTYILSRKVWRKIKDFRGK